MNASYSSRRAILVALVTIAGWSGAGIESKLFGQLFYGLADRIDDLKTTDDPTAISRVESEIFKLPTVSGDKVSAEAKAQREQKLRFMLRAYRVISARIDPAFDCDKDPVFLHIVPPGGYPAGIGPGAIKDPALRKQYEEALAENQQKMNRQNMQLTARRISQQLAFHIAATVRFSFTRADQGELDEVVRLEFPEIATCEEIQQALARADAIQKRDATGLARLGSSAPKAFRAQFEGILEQINQSYNEPNGFGFTAIPLEIAKFTSLPKEKDPVDFEARRALKTRLFLKAFHVASATIDPKWDRHGDNGGLYNGVPDKRTAAEREANKKKIERANRQNESRRFLQALPRLMFPYFQSVFGAGEQEELDKLVREELMGEPALRSAFQKARADFDAARDAR